MSHYQRLTMKVLDNVDPKILQKAVKRMGKDYSIKMTSQVKGVAKGLDGANAVLMKGDFPTTIGFRIMTTKEGKHPMDIIGESYRSGFSNLGEFKNELIKNYSVVNVQEMAVTNNYKEIENHVEEDGTIVIRYQVAA